MQFYFPGKKTETVLLKGYFASGEWVNYFTVVFVDLY